MIEVIKTGLYSSVQDKGRFGFENFGIPISGSMDQFSSSLSNKLLNNNEDAAVMEITMTGPVLKFHNKTKISITGADISPKLNNNPIRLNRAHSIKKDDILSFGKLKYGIRSYLSVLGGFLTKEVMKSRSMYANITESFRIVKGEYLKISSKKSMNTNSLITQFEYLDHFKSNEIKVYKGPEFDRLLKNEKITTYSVRYCTDFQYGSGSNRYYCCNPTRTTKSGSNWWGSSSHRQCLIFKCV